MEHLLAPRGNYYYYFYTELSEKIFIIEDVVLMVADQTSAMMEVTPGSLAEDPPARTETPL